MTSFYKNGETELTLFQNDKVSRMNTWEKVGRAQCFRAHLSYVRSLFGSIWKELEGTVSTRHIRMWVTPNVSVVNRIFSEITQRILFPAKHLSNQTALFIINKDLADYTG